jgi:hypothetical protein
MSPEPIEQRLRVPQVRDVETLREPAIDRREQVARLSCGSGMTCWRRLRDWQAAKVFERLHRALLDRLGRANAVDFGRCSLDSASFPAKRGANSPARTRPTAASWAPSAT